MTAPTPKASFAPMSSLRQDAPSHVMVSIRKVSSITSWEYPLAPPAQPKAAAAPASDKPARRILTVVGAGFSLAGSRQVVREPGLMNA